VDIVTLVVNSFEEEVIKITVYLRQCNSLWWIRRNVCVCGKTCWHFKVLVLQAFAWRRWGKSP